MKTKSLSRHIIKGTHFKSNRKSGTHGYYIVIRRVKTTKLNKIYARSTKGNFGWTLTGPQFGKLLQLGVITII